MHRIRNECEKQKCYLSSVSKVAIQLDAIHKTHPMNDRMTRSFFENLIGVPLSRCIQILDETLKKSRLEKDEIDNVVLIGGSSRIPKVQQMVQEYFGEKQICRSIIPDEAVACGAALYAHSIYKENGELFPVVTTKCEKSITKPENVTSLLTEPHLESQLPGLIPSKTLNSPKPVRIIASRNHLKNHPNINPSNLRHEQTNFDPPRTHPNPKLDLNANPKPVRIIEISPRNLLTNLVDKVMQKQRLTLKTDNLESILSQAGSRPVALLSIVGPSRLGKSFLLNYMVKYLRSLSATNSFSVPHSDWMGKSPDEPLRDGFRWKCGTNPETFGIWMWSEPFPLRTADGFEFDVLLMDTQGVFDSHTDIRDWSTIMGLSLLTSSCLIFNISKLFEEHILNSLKKFLDFGLMARDSSLDEELNARKPFQKLIFLVRDWDFPEDHPYGVAGGAAYLNSKLNEETTKDGEEIRTQIKSCFEQLDSCLMSDPGKLVKLNSYDGSVAKMDEEFAANIKEFIEHLFRPSSLAPKNILGNSVTGEDLLVYFEQLVKVFNKGDMPSNQELTQATVNSCNQVIVKRCFQTYKNSFEQFPKPELRTFLLEEELRDLSDKASRSSLNQFKSLRKMGSLQAIATARGELTTICDHFKNEFLVSNANARNEQVQRAEVKLQTFLETRLKELIRTKNTGRDKFVSEDVLLTMCANCKMEGQAILLKFFGLQSQSLNVLPNVDKQKLEDVTLAFIKSAQNINEGKKLKALAYLNELVVDLTNQYKLEMDAIIANHKYWQVPELINEDSALSGKLRKELHSEFCDSSIFPQGEQQLLTDTQKEFIFAYRLVQVRNENFLMTCAQCVSDLSKLYAEQMEKHAMEGVVGVLEGRSMGEAHAVAVQDCTRRLKDFEGFARLATLQKIQFEADLQFSIEKHCLHLVEKWSPRKRQNLLKAYKEQMNKAYGSRQNIFRDGKLLDLEEKHGIEKTRAMTGFTDFLNQLPIPQDAHEKLFTSKNVMLKDFEAELKNHMADIREKEKFRLDALQATAQGFLSEAKTKFLESANANNRACLDHEAYQLKFDEAELQVVQNFKDKCYANHLLKSSQQPLTQDLDNFIRSVPRFKTLHHGEVLEISGPSLKLRRELDVLDNILDSSLARIKEVRFIASDEIALDENICSEFWLGKNLIMYTQKMGVSGSSRIIDVSGKKGKSIPNASVPSTPEEPGKNGQNGVDGEPGESGGNSVLLASTILNPHHLKIISNGGVGGNGRGGGNGSPGVDGVDGDRRFHLSLKDLEENFPSPAKFFDQIEACVKKGKLSLARIGKGRDVKTLRVANSNNYYFELETEEGARLRYGFSQGKLKGLISGRSFYIWCQGARGTNGQPGGFGGLGGRGGSLGNPGAIDVPKEVAGDIVMMRKPGYNGRSGANGVAGKDGVCGKQGTDCAIVDPYAGLWIPTANFLPKRWFQGNLEMVVVEEAVVYKNFARCVNAWNKPFRWATSILSPGEQTEPSIPTIDDAAYCPNQSKFISFMSSLDMREALKVHPEPKEAHYLKPIKKTRNKQPIDKSALVNTYGKF